MLLSAARVAAALAFWVLIWQGAAMIVNQELIVPRPLTVLRQLLDLGATAGFWQAAGVSLLRMFIGYVLGIAAGVLAAFLTSTFRAADWLLSPAIRVVLATPVASFIILSLLWIGHTRVPAFISMLIVVPIVWANLCTAVRETDRDLLEMARLFRMKKSRVLRLIYIPAAMPSFRAACLTALGLAWKSGIAAEVLCLPKTAVGTQLYYSKIYLETPALFAWTIVVILLSFLLEKGITRLFSLSAGQRKEGRHANS